MYLWRSFATDGAQLVLQAPLEVHIILLFGELAIWFTHELRSSTPLLSGRTFAFRFGSSVSFDCGWVWDDKHDHFVAWRMSMEKVRKRD